MYFKRMLGKTEIIVMPRGMKKRIFYCSSCGERLYPYPRTKILERGDPDYKKYSRVRGKRIIGKIELTEYDLKCMAEGCSACDKSISYEEQCVIAEIQKLVGANVLSEANLEEHRADAVATLEKKRKTKDIIERAIGIVAVIVFLYCWLKSGNFSIKFYL